MRLDNVGLGERKKMEPDAVLYFCIPAISGLVPRCSMPRDLYESAPSRLGKQVYKLTTSPRLCAGGELYLQRTNISHLLSLRFRATCCRYPLRF